MQTKCPVCGNVFDVESLGPVTITTWSSMGPHEDPPEGQKRKSVKFTCPYCREHTSN